MDKVKINSLVSRILHDDENFFSEKDALELATMLPDSNEYMIQLGIHSGKSSKNQSSGATDNGQVDFDDDDESSERATLLGSPEYEQAGNFEVAKITKKRYISILHHYYDDDDEDSEGFEGYRLIDLDNGSWVLKKEEEYTIPLIPFLASFTWHKYRETKVSKT